MNMHKRDILIEKIYAQNKMIIYTDNQLTTKNKNNLETTICFKGDEGDDEQSPDKSNETYDQIQNKNKKLTGKTFLKNFNQIKEISVMVFSESTFHGLSRVIKTNILLIKCVWIAFLLLCVCLFAKFAINSLVNYLEYRVSTELRIVYETPTIFPTISICNKNKFTTDYSIKMIKNKTKSLNFTDIFNLTELIKMTMQERFHKIDDGISIFSNEVFKYSNEEKKKLGHSVDDFLIECRFDNIDCNVTEEFAWYFDNIYGNCYKYNSGYNSRNEIVELKKSKAPGKYYLGLKLTLFDSMPNLLKRTSVNGNGFVIRIENSSYRVGGNSVIDLLSGMETSVSVDRVYSTQLAYPYSNCYIDSETAKTFHSELYDMFMKYGKQYKQTDCLELCQQKFYINICNCTIIDMFSLYNGTNCNSREEIECLFQVYYEKILAQDFFKDNCYPICPLECNTTQYKTYQSSNQFDSEIYFDVVRKRTNFISEYDDQTLSHEAIQKGLVKVNIFYESLSYTQIQETVKMNEVTLIATIGGFMGMFLGGSLMTFVELFDILIRCFVQQKPRNEVKVQTPASV